MISSDRIKTHRDVGCYISSAECTQLSTIMTALSNGPRMPEVRSCDPIMYVKSTRTHRWDSTESQPQTFWVS